MDAIGGILIFLIIGVVVVFWKYFDYKLNRDFEVQKLHNIQHELEFRLKGMSEDTNSDAYLFFKMIYDMSIAQRKRYKINGNIYVYDETQNKKQ